MTYCFSCSSVLCVVRLFRPSNSSYFERNYSDLKIWSYPIFILHYNFHFGSAQYAFKHLRGKPTFALSPALLETIQLEMD